MRKTVRSTAGKREAAPDPTEADPFSRAALIASGVPFPRMPQDDDDEICSDDGAPGSSLAAWLAAGCAGPGAAGAGPEPAPPRPVASDSSQKHSTRTYYWDPARPDLDPTSPEALARADAIERSLPKPWHLRDTEPSGDRAGEDEAPPAPDAAVPQLPADPRFPERPTVPGEIGSDDHGKPLYLRPRKPGEEERFRPVGRRPGRPFSRYRLDWDKGADMLARGNAVKYVAQILGCHRSTIWRALQRSPTLVARISELRRRHAQQAGARLEGMRHSVVEAIHNKAFLGGTGDSALLIFLARQLGVFGADYLDPPAEAAAPGGHAVPAGAPAIAQHLAVRLQMMHFGGSANETNRLERDTEVAERNSPVAQAPALPFLTRRPVAAER